MKYVVVILLTLVLSLFVPTEFHQPEAVSTEQIITKLEELEINNYILSSRPPQIIYNELEKVEQYAAYYGISPAAMYNILLNANSRFIRDSDLDLLARVVSAEARGESRRGQVAVANVVLNRVNSTRFPNSIHDVIFQSGQFCSVSNGSINLEPTEKAKESAWLALMGYNVLGRDDVYFFYNAMRTSRNNWIRSRVVATTIGNHTFALPIRRQ